MRLEFTFGHLGLTNAQASLLVQVGRGVLIVQSVCRLLVYAREAIDSNRVLPLALTCYRSLSIERNIKKSYS